MVTQIQVQPTTSKQGPHSPHCPDLTVSRESNLTDSDEELSQEDARLAAAFKAGQRHIPRLVPPFDDAQSCRDFRRAVKDADEEGFIPPGYGFDPEEDEYIPWEPHEIILVARKETIIVLLEEKWRPLALRWARGLYILDDILSVYEPEEGHE